MPADVQGAHERRAVETRWGCSQSSRGTWWVGGAEAWGEQGPRLHALPGCSRAVSGPPIPCPPRPGPAPDCLPESNTRAAQPLQLVKPGGADTGDSGHRAWRGQPGKGLRLLHRRPEVRVSKMPVGMTKLELAGRSSALSLGPLTREEKALKTGMGRERAILDPHEGTSCSWVVVKHQETNLCQTHSSLSLLPSQTQRSSLSPPRIIRMWYSCAAINQSCFPVR